MYQCHCNNLGTYYVFKKSLTFQKMARLKMLKLISQHDTEILLRFLDVTQ